jgi:hypothetical protein
MSFIGCERRMGARLGSNVAEEHADLFGFHLPKLR